MKLWPINMAFGILAVMAVVALSELLGSPVYSATGSRCGRVREVAVVPQDDPSRLAQLVVKTRQGKRLLDTSSIVAVDAHGLHTSMPAAKWPASNGAEGMLLLERDLLDQQIIDVHGHKVRRVNDADITVEPHNGHVIFKLTGVDVGPRGIVRRLLRGFLPKETLHSLSSKLPHKTIPWEFVNLIETDPARRVKLKIEGDRLAKLHPADIADIIEELAPAEREAVIESLDEQVAAEALEEMDPRMQVSIVEAMDSDKAADIVQEMDPDAAADLLGDLPPETSEEILEEMEPAEREEVAGLLQHEQDTAAGRMTTDYLALSPKATGADARELLRTYEGEPENVSTIFLVSDDWKLVGAIPVAKLLLAEPTTPLGELSTPEPIHCSGRCSEKDVVELFDKYNLMSLPVVDEGGHLTGVITADDVISLLHSKL
jgi:magnesium transporter